MNAMIERVARAICAATDIAMEGGWEPVLDNPDYVIPGHKRTDGKAIARWQLYIPQARAAIEAMRELPEAPGPHYTNGEYSRRTQEAMVSDALGQGALK